MRDGGRGLILERPSQLEHEHIRSVLRVGCIRRQGKTVIRERLSQLENSIIEFTRVTLKYQIQVRISRPRRAQPCSGGTTSRREGSEAMLVHVM